MRRELTAAALEVLLALGACDKKTPETSYSVQGFGVVQSLESEV
jgi:hypothetical protein